jgi:hypothetical protein
MAATVTTGRPQGVVGLTVLSRQTPNAQREKVRCVTPLGAASDVTA